MKAMWIAFAAMIVIALGAWLVLERSGFSSAERTISPSVRLD